MLICPSEYAESARKNEVKKLRSLLDSHSKSLIEIEATVHHFPFNELNYDTDPINVDVSCSTQTTFVVKLFCLFCFKY